MKNRVVGVIVGLTSCANTAEDWYGATGLCLRIMYMLKWKDG
jgi:hypothetical protein